MLHQSVPQLMRPFKKKRKKKREEWHCMIFMEQGQVWGICIADLTGGSSCFWGKFVFAVGKKCIITKLREKYSNNQQLLLCYLLRKHIHVIMFLFPRHSFKNLAEGATLRRHYYFVFCKILLDLSWNRLRQILVSCCNVAVAVRAVGTFICTWW